MAFVEGWDGVTGAWGAELSAAFVSGNSGPLQVGTPVVNNRRTTNNYATGWVATMVATGSNVIVYVSVPTGTVSWAADFKARHRT